MFTNSNANRFLRTSVEYKYFNSCNPSYDVIINPEFVLEQFAITQKLQLKPNFTKIIIISRGDNSCLTTDFNEISIFLN